MSEQHWKWQIHHYPGPICIAYLCVGVIAQSKQNKGLTGPFTQVNLKPGKFALGEEKPASCLGNCFFHWPQRRDLG